LHFDIKEIMPSVLSLTTGSLHVNVIIILFDELIIPMPQIGNPQESALKQWIIQTIGVLQYQK
jgi:hypothetical protein